MAKQAVGQPITGRPISLSEIIRDPYVRAAFERASRDLGQEPGLVQSPVSLLPLTGSAAAELEGVS